MRLNSIRDLEGMRPVLRNPEADGPAAVYWVFGGVSERWENLTVITPGKYTSTSLSASGEEYPKTFGHYHSVKDKETYHLISGEGLLLLQKQHNDNGVLVPELIDEVLIVAVKPGEETVITQEWGHSWINVGETPLLSFDDWRAGHTPGDYSAIERLHGLAYYIIQGEDGKPKAVPNTNYRNLPEAKWISAEEFKKRASFTG